MRVLLSTIGSRGDVQPLVALAVELRAHGHDVRLCVPPDFREWIEGIGVAVTPIGPELRTFALPPKEGPPDPEHGRRLVEESVAVQFETVAAAARDCDAIVAATALQIAARSVAERMGIPYVFAAYCPNVLPSPHHAPPPLPAMPGFPAPPATAGNRELWNRDTERFNAVFGAALNRHRASLGMSAVTDVRSHVFGDQPWLAADATLAPWPGPAADGVFQTGAWLLSDDRPLSAELLRFLDIGEPPVYFGFGSMRAAPPDLGGVMLEAARTVGRRAIVSRGWADLSIPPGQPDCFSIGEVNQQALFRRVAAVVHHGGAGTTTAAALAGAPQVIVPQMYDQHYWAARVHDLGIGTAHAPGAPTVSSLRSSLERTLGHDVVARATSVAATVRRDGTRLAVQRLDALAPQP